VVGFGGEPASISSAEIEAIRTVVDSSVKAEPHPFLKCGDHVRVMAGPLRGLEGILLRKKNWCKLLLSVEMLQRSVAVEIDVALVQRIGGRVRPESHVRVGRIPLNSFPYPAESL